MRSLKRTKYGGYEDAEVGVISCPHAYDQEKGVFNCCQDECAWFNLKTVSDGGIIGAFCGDKVIGNIA